MYLMQQSFEEATGGFAFLIAAAVIIVAGVLIYKFVVKK